MREKINQIARNQFIRNVSTLAMGTIISQTVVIITSPLLARLFSVEDFGNLSVFTSVSIFFAVISTGRFELALGLPQDSLKMKMIFKLIIYIGFSVSLLYFLIIVFLRDVIHFHDKSEFLEFSSSYFSPLYIFFIAVFSALGYWFQRKKKYREITIANAIQVLSTSIFSIFFGLLHINHGLIFSLILGIIISSIYLVAKDKEFYNISSFSGSVMPVAREYSSFPKYMIFSDLSLTASQQFIPILFSALYSTTVVGFFSMANRMIRLPNIIITSSIGNVFRNDAIDEIREKGNCESLYKSTFRKLIIMSFPIFLVIFIISPKVFQVFFGEKWEMAGHFARILSVMLFVEFIVAPLNTLFYIREKQKMLMRLQIVNAVLGGVMIFLGYYYFESSSYSLMFFCANSILFNLIFLYNSYKIAGNV